jgi:hypothetical protein
MATLINLSLDLAKIDKSKIVEKEGKKFYSITISINNETKFGNNVSSYDNQSKEEREAGAKKNYLGNGKVFWTDGTITVAEKENTNPIPISDEIDNDLGF